MLLQAQPTTLTLAPCLDTPMTLETETKKGTELELETETETMAMNDVQAGPSYHANGISTSQLHCYHS
jgi:hypothetical protein